MKWHYQLGFKVIEGEKLFGVVEVYRNEDGRICLTSKDFTTPSYYEDAESVISSLEQMLKDCNEREILDLDNIQYAEAL